MSLSYLSLTNSQNAQTRLFFGGSGPTAFSACCCRFLCRAVWLLILMMVMMTYILSYAILTFLYNIPIYLSSLLLLSAFVSLAICASFLYSRLYRSRYRCTSWRRCCLITSSSTPNVFATFLMKPALGLVSPMLLLPSAALDLFSCSFIAAAIIVVLNIIIIILLLLLLLLLMLRLVGVSSIPSYNVDCYSPSLYLGIVKRRCC
jgi:hypothetical protein